jgi:hypothetical protein
MPTFLDMVAANFATPTPLAPHEPSQAPPEPPPEVQLGTTAVVHRGEPPPAWPGPDDLADVAAARRQLREAEENLRRLQKDIAEARAAGVTRPPGAADFKRYLEGGKVPSRDKDAAAAAEKAALLQGLLPEAERLVAEARLAGEKAWEQAPAALWRAAAPEWEGLVLRLAASLCMASLAQLALRSFDERYAEHLRRHRLPEAAAVPAGFDPPGRPPARGAFGCLLLPTAPRPGNDVVILLEQLRQLGLLHYRAFDLRPLDWSRATDAALLALDDVVRQVAGQPRPGAATEPEPDKKGA